MAVNYRKYLSLDAGVQKMLESVIESAGSADANKLISLDANGLIDHSMYDTTFMASKTYVDAALNGLKWKDPVRVISKTNLASLAGKLTIDTVTLVAGDRVLVVGQTDKKENGIYAVGASNPWTWVRVPDGDAGSELLNAACFISEGSVGNADTAYVCTTNNPAIGSTDIEFVQFFGGAMVSAGAGLSMSGNEMNIDNGWGLSVSGASLDLVLDGGTLTLGAAGLKVTPNTFAAYSHEGATGSAHGPATALVDGFLTASDFSKLGGIASGAQVNVPEFATVQVGTVSITADSVQDSFSVAAGNNARVVGDAGTSTLTIESDVEYLPVGTGGVAVGNLVAYLNDSGTVKVIKATNAGLATKAVGFVKAAVASGGNVYVYKRGELADLTGLTAAGDLFLGTGGAIIAPADLPTASNAIIQMVGKAKGATSAYIEFSEPVVIG